MDSEWVDFLEEKFVAPKFKTSGIHESIYKLDSSLIITPNFDKIYDNYAQSESKGTIRAKMYNDPDLGDIVRGDAPAVLKIHGTIDTPASMIFTRHDYLKARREYPNLYGLLEALVVTHTFLFLGCGLDDPDMQLFLEKGVHSHSQNLPHFITLPKPISTDLQASYRRNLNLRVLSYSAVNDHAELAESLVELVSLIESSREDIAATQRW